MPKLIPAPRGHEARSAQPNRRVFLIAGSALVASGCFGSFGATMALYDWNKGVSDNKWLRWLVFLVCVILPVYWLFILADAIVLNTIEFFTGKHPVGGGSVALPDGHKLASSATEDPNLVKHEVFDADGERVRTLYVRKLDDTHMQLLDEDKKPVGSARVRPDGAVEILDGDGKVRSTIPKEQVQEVSAAFEHGASPSRAVAEAIPLEAPDTQVADARR